ncbi:MAG: tetratricopeptide repeat protein [Thermodesulfobacteriota bacterium]
MGFDFVGFDDPAFTTENPLIQKGISREGIREVFRNPDYFCMQLSVLSHMLDCELFGLDPGRHHFVNLIFHLLNVLLLFILMKRLGGDILPSAAVAALFAVHPLNVESVAWIAERRNVLSTFFWFAATLAYIRYTERRSLTSYILMTVFFVFGLMSKAMLVTLPFTLLLLDFWPLERIQLNGASSKPEAKISNLKSQISNSYGIAVLEKLPLMIISVAASYLTLIAAQNTGGAPGIGGLMSAEELPIGFRFANAMVSYSAYLVKTVWPFDLSLNYPLNKNLSLWQILPAAAFLVAVTGISFWTIRTRPWLAVGWLWYLGTLTPVIGIIQLGHQAMADRYVYVPLIGIFIMVSWTVADWNRMRPFRGKTVMVWAMLLIALMTVNTILQNRYWRNTVTLFEHVIHISPTYTLAYYNLGVALRKMGRSAEAFHYFSKATAMAPDFAEANFFMALFFTESNQPDKAIAYYHKALSRKPELTEARFNLARLFTKLSQWEEAENQYRKILTTKPNDPDTLHALGNLFERQNQPEIAAQYYRKAIQGKPDSAMFHQSLGASFEKMGNFAEASRQYTEAIRIDPGNTNLYNQMAILMFKQGKMEEAFRYFHRALTINPKDANTYYNMAVSYSKLNRIEEAIQHYTKVIEIDESFADARKKRDMLLNN